MAFHIDTYNMPPLRCYGDANLYWDRIKPWRGDGDTNTRPLAGRNKRHMTIRKLNDNSIAMRLHHTDVVTYHPDGDITLQAYESISTDMFANNLTPSGVSTSFNSQGGRLVHLEQDGVIMTYKMALNSVRLRRDGASWRSVLPEEFKPFVRYGVDVKKARGILKDLRYSDFCAWYKAANALCKPTSELMQRLTPDDVVRYLREGGSKWEVLRATLGPEDVRVSVYATYKCITTTEVPAIAGHDISAITASYRRWGGLVTQSY